MQLAVYYPRQCQFNFIKFYSLAIIKWYAWRGRWLLVDQRVVPFPQGVHFAIHRRDRQNFVFFIFVFPLVVVLLGFSNMICVVNAEKAAAIKAAL